MVMGISLKIIGDRAAAEEVLLETFWQVWQEAASYPGQGRSFTGWLYKLARDLAADISRRKLNIK
jgi:DNA-directed RNA polymerase specialized sigma24 family protein